jgi:hypothetical protein
MSRNRFVRKLFHKNLFEVDQVKLVYFLSLVVGFIFKSRIFSAYRDLLVEFSEE